MVSDRKLQITINKKVVLEYKLQKVRARLLSNFLLTILIFDI